MKKIIYNTEFNVEDYRDIFIEEYPELEDNEVELYQFAADMNHLVYEDELYNLAKEVPGTIVIFADLGLWSGRQKAHKNLKSSHLSAILSLDSADEFCWYAEDGDVWCRATHHDGTNIYRYRYIPDSFDDDIDEWLYENANDNSKINDVTKSIYPMVASIYGWSN